MSNENYLNLLRSQMADKRSMIEGLRERLSELTDDSDKRSLQREIQRTEQDISNIETQLRYGK